ncbi:MAG: class I SAM-dependent methyltransferase [Flavobacteriales bacterium]|nr:class I SAM-dependent methyltransferase [Flavobacteriales bacterium]
MKDDQVKKYYEEEAEKYEKEFYRSESDYPTLRIRHNYILEMVNSLSLPSSPRILDIGCGTGEMVRDLMSPERQIYGLDISPNMIKIAQEKCAKPKVEKCEVSLGTGDIENLAFDDQSFDLVICSGVIEYLKDDNASLKELKRVIKPEGYLIINVTNKFSVRKWTAPLVESLKSNRVVYSSMNFVKESILKKGKLHHFPFKPRVHSPKAFDLQLLAKGFVKLEHRYFDFAILPAPLDTIFGVITDPMKRYLERYSKNNMTISGAGYLVSTQLRDLDPKV